LGAERINRIYPFNAYNELKQLQEETLNESE